MGEGVSILGGTLVYTLIFLLPGLIGTSVYRLLAEGRKLGTFDLLTFSLFLTLGGNALAETVFGISLFPDIQSGDDRLIVFSYANFSVLGLLLSSTGSIVIALGLVLASGRGWLFRIGQKFRLTRKSGRVNVWHDIFNDFQGRWINVTFKNGTSIIGWPKYYSVDEEKFEIFLAEALIRQPAPASETAGTIQSWNELEVSGPGVYINNMDEILFISVIGETSDD